MSILPTIHIQHSGIPPSSLYLSPSHKDTHTHAYNTHIHSQTQSLIYSTYTHTHNNVPIFIYTLNSYPQFYRYTHNPPTPTPRALGQASAGLEEVSPSYCLCRIQSVTAAHGQSPTYTSSFISPPNSYCAPTVGYSSIQVRHTQEREMEQPRDSLVLPSLMFSPPEQPGPGLESLRTQPREGMTRGDTWIPPILPALGVSELPRNQKWS